MLHSKKEDKPDEQGTRSTCICHVRSILSRKLCARPDVLAVLDASGSGFDVQEELDRRRMATAGVVLTTTNTAVAELDQDWSTPQGLKLVPLIMASEPNTPGYVG
jgi:hypothetical protein